MKDQAVLTEIDGNTMTPEQQANIIESRWVLKQTHNEVRARVLAKGYTEPVTDHDPLSASAPLFCTLRIFLTMALVYNWSVSAGGVCVACLHAEAISHSLVMRPPHEFYNDENRHHVAAEQSHLWPTTITKTMARSHSTHSHSHT